MWYEDVEKLNCTSCENDSIPRMAPYIVVARRVAAPVAGTVMLYSSAVPCCGGASLGSATLTLSSPSSPGELSGTQRCGRVSSAYLANASVSVSGTCAAIESLEEQSGQCRPIFKTIGGHENVQQIRYLATAGIGEPEIRAQPTAVTAGSKGSRSGPERQLHVLRWRWAWRNTNTAPIIPSKAQRSDGRTERPSRG